MQRRKLSLKFVKALAGQRGCSSLLKLFDKPMVQTELSVYLVAPVEVMSEIGDGEIEGIPPAFAFDPVKAGRQDE